MVAGALFEFESRAAPPEASFPPDERLRGFLILCADGDLGLELAFTSRSATAREEDDDDGEKCKSQWGRPPIRCCTSAALAFRRAVRTAFHG
jgi:hypothetical protein